MDQDSDTSMEESVVAAPSGRSKAESNTLTLMTASRLRRLQRRRAAAAQLAPVVVASTPSVGGPSRPVDVAAGGNGNHEMEVRPAFDQLVRALSRSLTVPTKRVHVWRRRRFCIMLQRKRYEQRRISPWELTCRIAPWPQGLSFDHAIRLTMAQATSRPEEIVGQLFQ